MLTSILKWCHGIPLLHHGSHGNKRNLFFLVPFIFPSPLFFPSLSYYLIVCICFSISSRGLCVYKCLSAFVSSSSLILYLALLNPSHDFLALYHVFVFVWFFLMFGFDPQAFWFWDYGYPIFKFVCLFTDLCLEYYRTLAPPTISTNRQNGVNKRLRLISF